MQVWWATPALVGLGLVSCQAGTTFLTLPDDPEAQSAIVIVADADDNALRVAAFDLTAPAAVELQLPKDKVELQAFTYRSKLSVLALSGGELPLAISGGGARVLPKARARFAASVEPSHTAPWSPLDASPFEDLQIAAPTLSECAEGGGCLIESPEDPSDRPFCFTPCPEPPSPAPPIAPSPPAEPTLPVFTPCPAGWTETTDRSGVTFCEPPAPIATATCSTGEVQRYGATVCTPFDPCSGAPWALDVPAGLSRTYVRAGATGGNGSEAAPFGSLAAAISAGSGPRVIMIAQGRYRESVDLPGEVSLWGTCAGEVVIEGASPARAVVIVGGPNAALRHLSIEDGAAGVLVPSATSLTLDRVIIGAGAGAGIDVGTASLTATEVWIHERQGNALSLNGASATLSDCVVDHSGPLELSGSSGRLSRTVLRGDALRLLAMSAAGSDLTLDQVTLVRATGAAINLGFTSHLDASDVRVESTLGSNAIGINVSSGSSAEIRRVVVREITGTAILIQEGTTTATLTDVAVLQLSGAMAGDAAFGVSMGAKAEVVRAMCRDTEPYCFRVTTGARLVASDALSLTGANQVADPGSRLVLRRAFARELGVQRGAGADLEDLTLVDTRRGLDFFEATGRVARARVERSQVDGVSITRSGVVPISDLTVLNVAQYGVHVFAGSSTRLERARIGDAVGASIALSTPEGMTLTSTLVDIDVRGPEASGADEPKEGLIHVETSVSLERVRLAGGSRSGVRLEHGETDPDVAASISDLSIDGVGGFGLLSSTTNRVSLTRAQIRGPGCAGILLLQGTSGEAVDLAVLEARSIPSARCRFERPTGGVFVGTGLAVPDASTFSVRRFLLTSAAARGSVVGANSQLILSEGEISSQPQGILVSGADHALEDLLFRVRYRDNQSAIVVQP